MDHYPTLLLRSTKTVELMDEFFQIPMMLTNAVDEYVLLTKPMMIWMNPLLLLLLSRTKRMLLCHQHNLLRVGMSMKSSNRASNKKLNKKHSNRVSYRVSETMNRKRQIRASQNNKRLVMDNDSEQQTSESGMANILFQNAYQGLHTTINSNWSHGFHYTF
jgi:nitrogenase subunit NifH